MVDFRKSVRCDTGSCVEVAIGNEVEIRNSTDPEQKTSFPKDQWQLFVAAVKAGKVDVPEELL